jgi:sigma-B regulation protein RsbU (phosphoserine phosphatase)
MVQAGHPHPMLIRASGEVVQLGDGGLPIGLIPDAPYERFEVTLRPGDRLVLISDGLTECPLPDGQDFGVEGLTESLKKSAHLSGADLLEALVWDLSLQSGSDSFPDDISGVVFDLLPDEPGQHPPVPRIAKPPDRLFDW